MDKQPHHQVSTALRAWFIRFYGVHLATFVVALVIVGTQYGHFLDQTSGRLLGDLFQVTLKHLESELRDLPKEQWVGAISEYQIEVGAPVHVRPIDQFNLSPENQNALHKGEIVLVADSGIFIEQIEGTELVITLGPIEYLSFMQRERWVEIMALSLLALLLGIPAYLAMQPLSRDLRRLDQSARQLSQGELSTRTLLNDTSPILSLGQTFNTMAANLEALDRHKTDMASVVSHELRLPIARLRYRLDWIQSQSPETAESVNECTGELDALSDLVDELLIYGRLQQPKIQLRREVLNTEQWIRSTLARLDIPKHLQVHITIAPNAPAQITADRTYIERALLNLLSNAMRYARSEIHITLEGEGQLARLTVDDDGPGIPATECEHIFEPFARLDRENTGYGLGLAIVLQVIQSHGGQAWAEASPQKGARLVLRWPSSGNV